MAEMSLSFAIEAINKASEGINSAKESISGLEGAAGSAHGATSQLGQDIEGLGEKGEGASSGGLGSLISGFGGLAVATAGAGAALGVAASVVDSSIDKVSDLAEHTEKLSAALGETPEHASEMLFAFQQMGLNSDQATKDLDKFSKGLAGLVENADGTTTTSNALTKQLAAMGIAVTDATGKALPMQQVLGEVADQFQKMPDGPEKTALAMQLFGKQGAELIPFLDQGSAGLASMYQQADKLGLTLSGSTIDSVHQATQAHREMSAAIDGLEVQIGVALMPVVASLATALANFAIWINTDGVPMLKQFMQNFQGVQDNVQQLVKFFQENWGTIKTVMEPLVDFIVNVLIAQIKTFADVVKTQIDLVRGVFQVLIDLIHGDFSGAWRDLQQLVRNVVGDVVNTVRDQLQPIINIATGIVTDLRNGIATVIGGLESDLVNAWDSVKTTAETAWQNLVQGIEDKANDLLTWFQNLPGNILSALGDLASTLYDAGVKLITGLENGIIAEAKNLPGQVGNAIQGAINNIPGAGAVLSHIPGLAEGGIVQQPTLAVVGEAGPEAVIPLKNISTVQPPPFSASGLAGMVDSGGGYGTQTSQLGQGQAAAAGTALGPLGPDAGMTTTLHQILQAITKSDTSTQMQELTADITTVVKGGAWTAELSRKINDDLSAGHVGQALTDIQAATHAATNLQLLPNMLDAIHKSDASTQMSTLQTDIADLVHGGAWTNGLASEIQDKLASGDVGAALKIAAGALTEMQRGGMLNQMINAINQSNQQATLQQIQQDISDAWQHGEWTPKLADQIQADLAAGNIGQALKDITAATQTSAQHLTVMDSIQQANAAAAATIAAGQATAQHMAAVNVGAGSFAPGGITPGAFSTLGLRMNAAGYYGMAGGGLITEPIYGVGASGQAYMFGENGPERVTPGTGGGGIVVNISALDAQGVYAAMPTIARQLQLYLQRSGYNGLS